MHRHAMIGTGVVLALTVGVGVALLCAPSSSPPPNVYEQMLEEGCGGSQIKHGLNRVQVHAQRRTANDLGLSGGAAGKLRFENGVRLQAGALRVGALRGSILTGKWGLVAVAESKQWLAFDIRHGELDAINAISVGPMIGATFNVA